MKNIFKIAFTTDKEIMKKYKDADLMVLADVLDRRNRARGTLLIILGATIYMFGIYAKAICDAREAQAQAKTEQTVNQK